MKQYNHYSIRLEALKHELKREKERSQHLEYKYNRDAMVILIVQIVMLSAMIGIYLLF